MKYPVSVESVGDHIRAKRLDIGLIQKEVARLIGVDLKTICNWELNLKQPALRFLPRIIEFVGYDPSMEKSVKIGDGLKHYRKTLGLTQKQLAKLMGIDPTTLSRIERDGGRTFPITRIKVLDYFKAKEGPDRLKDHHPLRDLMLKQPRED